MFSFLKELSQTIFFRTNLNKRYFSILRGLKNSKTKEEFKKFHIEYVVFILHLKVINEALSSNNINIKITDFKDLKFLKTNPFYLRQISEMENRIS